jgi:hypothetical protein
MDLTVSVGLNEARLTATRDYIDAGASHGKLRLYTTPRPAAGAAITTQVLIAEIDLDEPCGTVASNSLELTAALPAIVANSGDVTWGRIVDGSGNYAIDGDASDMAGSGHFKLDATTLTAGSTVALVACALG